VQIKMMKCASTACNTVQKLKMLS